MTCKSGTRRQGLLDRYFVDFPQIFELVVKDPMQAFHVVVQAETIETRILVITR